MRVGKMSPRLGRSVAAALALSLAVVLSGCGGGGEASEPSTGAAGPAGDPVSGGTINALQISEPRNLDPGILLNASQGNALLGNALYGTLMISNENTGEIEYSIATDFSSADEGKTFVLTLRDGVTFSDGSPLTAEDVKYNWDRLKDESLASNSLHDAQNIDSTEVISDTELKVELIGKQPYFATQIIESSLNWIAKPAALEAGANSFDANPIGAGPFTLSNWARGGNLTLAKSDSYWDAPRPYLDSITLTTTGNSQQRVNAITTADADLASENDWLAVQKAMDGELQVVVQPQAGGQFLSLNTRRAPFDNPTAREAVALAIDVNALNLALYGEASDIVHTLFPEGHPLFNDVELNEYDPERAQELFDELQAAGTPVDFTFTVFSGNENIGEAVQTQLSNYKNITVDIEVVDWSETGRIFGSHDFDMAVQAANFVDPEPVLFNAFQGDASRNGTGIADDELSAALEQGRFTTDQDERLEAYTVVAERLAALHPAIFYVRAAQTATATDKVGGIDLYGRGSILADRLWLEQ